MLYYVDRTDLDEEIDLTKSSNCKDCIVYHYWYSNNGFKFQNSICNGCQDLTMVCLNLRDITIITVKGVEYRVLFMTLANRTQFICCKFCP